MPGPRFGYRMNSGENENAAGLQVHREVRYQEYVMEGIRTFTTVLGRIMLIVSLVAECRSLREISGLHAVEKILKPTDT
jgi:hypothetical protein